MSSPRSTPNDLGRGTLVLILAGGRGQRLRPLTEHRAKGAVPFAGHYRLIDFPLSNCLHSGTMQICILAQYKLASLERHLRLGWSLFRPELHEWLGVSPPQQRCGDRLYGGTADAVFQSLYTVARERAGRVLVLAADHVYRMDYRPLLEQHANSGAEVTVSCLEIDAAQAGRFGVVQTDPAGRIAGFQEKPSQPRTLPGRPDRALASMGIYVFEAGPLTEALCRDAEDPHSTHDFGRDVIPRMLADGFHLRAYHAGAQEGGFYWRDVGDLDAYWEASMELLQGEGVDLGDPDWPIHTYRPDLPPSRLCCPLGRSVEVVDSLVCGGVTVSNGGIVRSVLSPGVMVGFGAEVVDSVLMDGVRVGAGARVHRSIVDKGVHIPAGCVLSGKGPAPGIVHSPNGVTVVAKEVDLTGLGEEDRHALSYYGLGPVERKGMAPAPGECVPLAAPLALAAPLPLAGAAV